MSQLDGWMDGWMDGWNVLVGRLVQGSCSSLTGRQEWIERTME